MSHGLYRPATDIAGAAAELAAWQLVLPGSGVFTHLTAARQYGWWLPPLPEGLPVFVDIAQTDPRPRRSGLRVVRRPRPVAHCVMGGVRLANPSEALLACARHLGLLDLVVLCDCALHLSACTLAELAEASSQRARGAPSLRRALRLVDARSESAWESLLRVLHVVCDIDVEPQHLVLADDGTQVARADLWLRGTRTIHEYDGGEHRHKRRHRKDLRRERALGDTTWTRRGYLCDDVLTQGVTILRDADRSLGRVHRPERIRAWHRLLVDSLFTPSGTARFRQRAGLLPAPATGHESAFEESSRVVS